MQRDPVTVLGEIARCAVVLSSSLHGLIAADAFGHRTAWLELSDAVIGAGYKFRDYYGAFRLSVRSHALTGRETLDELEAKATLKPIDIKKKQDELAGCFRRL